MSARTNRHREYTSSLAIWARCRNVRAGEDAVKAAGVTYLPKLGGQTTEEYDAYRQRSRLYNAFGKTIDGFVGLAIRKSIQIDAADAMEEILDDIDRQGSDVQGYFKSILSEILTTGRGGTLVDFNRVDSAATLQQTVNARPYWVSYEAEDILDWEYTEGVLTYVVVREYVSERGNTRASGDNYRYRELLLDNKVYMQKVWEPGSDTPEEITPQMSSKNMPFIPFVIHQTDFEVEVVAPPLLDLVNLCLSHYRLKADHMHALHYVALPTPYVIGIDEKDAPKTIGPQKVWVISSVDATVGILEFTGAGVSSIEKELKSMEDQMAILGARILLPEVSENTATASILRSVSETSDLASIVRILEKQLNQLLKFTQLWSGASGDPSTSIDKNFIPKELDAGMVTALVATWQAGGFDHETLIFNFKRAEIVPEGRDLEEIQSAVQEEEDERAEKAATAMALLTASEKPEEEEEEDG